MKSKLKKIHILTLGCAKNTVDSEFLDAQLRANQFTVTENIIGADLCIINTCGFIESAKEQSINTILETIQQKKKGKTKRTFCNGMFIRKIFARIEKKYS